MSATAQPNPTQQGSTGGYTVLARRYRSRDFDELVGQEPIARTLQNAIASNRTAHAYLFCGTRGVGKTSMARIFAKALNATEDLAQREQVVEAILRGEDLDVVEIDGASNRGVQEARDLIAGAGLSPTRSPYKIYIIDEVHMLTREAFNALLKTMEEPPSHVKFILCTTEPQKVPATIQSRCQRFDFRALSSQKIADQLNHILAAEGIEAEPEAVSQVARMGNGSMRDALSLLDRLLSAGEARLTVALLEQMLGLPDQAVVREVIDAAIGGDLGRALASGAELLARGASIEQALEMLAEHLRMLLIVCACGEESALAELTEEHRKAAAAQAAHFDAAGLTHFIALCDATARNARNSAAARALFDACLARMCLADQLADVTALLAGRPAPARQSKKKAAPAVAASEPPSALEPTLASASMATAPHPDSTEGRAEVAIEVKAPGQPAVAPRGLDALWNQVVEGATSSRLAWAVERVEPREFDGRTLQLDVKADALPVARMVVAQRAAIEQLARSVANQPIHVQIHGPTNDGDAEGPHRRAMESAAQDPIIAKAVSLFDARIIAVDSIDQAAAEEKNDV